MLYTGGCSVPSINYVCFERYLDKANDLGMKVVLEISHSLVDNHDVEGVRTFVNRLKSKPAVLGYLLSDEPDNALRQGNNNLSPESLLILYNVIKQEDPSRLVFLVHGAGGRMPISYDCSLFGDPSRHQYSCYTRHTDTYYTYDLNTCGDRPLCVLNYYSAAADVEMLDYYPHHYLVDGRDEVRDPPYPLQQTREWVSFMKAKNGKKFIPVIQASYQLSSSQSIPPNRASDHPTKQEFRYYSIANLIDKTYGLVFYLQPYATVPVIQNIITPTIGDLRYFTPVFLNGQQIPCSPSGYCAENVSSSFISASLQEFHAAVSNNAADYKRVVFTFPSNVNQLWLYESGTRSVFTGFVGINGNSVTLDLEPWSSYLFILRKP